MLGEFLLRLLVALPLVCAAAALSIWAVKRGWLRLPRLGKGFASRPAGEGEPPLDLVVVRALGPGARLAVVRFDGRTHLLGQAGPAITLLASATTPTAPLEKPAEAAAPCAS